MRRLRFRLGTLLILIMVLGVGFAALRESDDAWDSGVFSLTLGVFLICVGLTRHDTMPSTAHFCSLSRPFIPQPP
jgi:hypothetical protein